MVKETIGEKLSRWVMPLFMEKKDGKQSASIGRVCFWIAFIPAIYIWINTGGAQDIAANHASILFVLAAYNLGKKGIDVANNKFNGNNDGEGPG